jgi:hypothetical protein
MVEAYLPIADCTRLKESAGMHGWTVDADMQVMILLCVAGLFLAATILDLLSCLFCISVSHCSRVKLSFDTLVI